MTTRHPALQALHLVFVCFASAVLAVSSGAGSRAADQGPPPAGRPVFADVAQAAGLTHRTVFGGTDKNTYILETTGTGVAFLDYDNDGVLDLFFANGTTLAAPASDAEHSHLYHGNGDGTFSDVTGKAGVGRSGWGQGVAVGDYDNDGFPDLYLTFYGRNVLFRNNGNGTFTDLTEKAGVGAGGWSIGAVWGDYNNDVRPDLLVANDAQPNQLYRNRGDGTFEDVALTAGVAVDEDGRERAGMGVDFGDYDNDGSLDIAIGNFYGEPCALYRNRRDGLFDETTWSSSIGPPTVPTLTWGTRFFDYDNDGWKDLLFVNGHVYPEVDAHPLDETFAQRALLFRNNGDGTYANVGTGAGDVWGRRWAGRGAAIGDYDNDGDLDIAIAVNNGPPILLQNRGGDAAHWLSVKLVGSHSNRDAIGARLTG